MRFEQNMLKDQEITTYKSNKERNQFLSLDIFFLLNVFLESFIESIKQYIACLKFV